MIDLILPQSDVAQSDSAEGPLAGRRLGFYTSVFGMGGSEVLVADAMEAAYQAGADVICWSEPDAAIRRITAARAKRLQVTHLDWPAGPGVAATVSLPSPTVATPAPYRFLAAAWRRAIPFAVKRWVGFRRTARAFAAELRRVTPDLLFVNVNGSEAVSLAGPACGVPVVNCYHLSYTRSAGGPLSRAGDWAARRATMNCGVLTVHTSAAVRDEWCRLFGYPSARTRLIYNGVESVELPDRAQTRAALGLAKSEFAFCVPGRLDLIKGHRYLFEAIHAIRDRIAGGRVLVCGDGPLRAELEHAVEQSGLATVVRFLGWRTDLPAILHAADCTILPSVASENLSVAVLESLMAGTPVIVTRIGGMAEAVREGVNGLVVQPADPQSLGAAMLGLLTDPAKAWGMRAAARQAAMTRFTRERMMAEYVDVFVEILSHRAAEVRL